VLLRGEHAGTAFGASELVTGASERVTARLADGSVIRLAPDSRIQLTGTRDSRDVWLNGRAFFAVAKDEARPFTVRTRVGEVLVLGTPFEVSVERDDMRVVVLEGRVTHAASGETVSVGPGEVSQIVGGASPAVEKVEDVHSLLEWMDHVLVFDSMPLRKVADEIERHCGVRVILPDSTLSIRTVTARFTDQSVEEVLMVICRIVDARCSVRDSVVTIEP
jgi:transmembrane sensor